jgi:hypothetical protein
MSYPNSVPLDKLSWTNLTYLTNSYASKISDVDFDLNTGKPLNNMSRTNNIDKFFATINNSLKERNNISNNFVFQYPQVTDVSAGRDIVVSDEVSIDAVFISEGAAMKNMFGYYFYYIDDDGNKILLDNDGQVKEGDHYYKPTIIFPNVTCEPDDRNTLQQGDTRRLKGNLPNGNFSNICVGFFLVCFGWYAHITNTDINDRRILYSTIEFNTQQANNSQYDFVNNYIYSVFAKSVNEAGDELLFVAFEDILYGTPDDLDYNDAVIGFQISDITKITNYNDFTNVINDNSEPVVHNNIIKTNQNSEYVTFPSSEYNFQSKSNYIFERHLNYSNSTDRDNYYDCLKNMRLNYLLDIDKVDEDRLHKIIVKHLFRSNDISGNRVSGVVTLSLMDIRFNNDIFDNVNKFSNLYLKNKKDGDDGNYYESYRLYKDGDHDTELDLIKLKDEIDRPREDNDYDNGKNPNNSKNSNLRITGSGNMDTYYNDTCSFPIDHPAIYQAYKSVSKNNVGLTINIKMDDHPTGYMLNKKYFFRYACFIVDNDKHIVVDLGNLDIYQEVSGKLNKITDIASLNNTYNGYINVSDVSSSSSVIKKLVTVFSKKNNASYRLITIKNNQVFYCIRLANVKNNPTMLYYDSSYNVNWANSVNNLSGSYFIKKKFFVLNSFTGSDIVTKSNGETHGNDHDD